LTSFDAHPRGKKRKGKKEREEKKGKKREERKRSSIGFALRGCMAAAL
jgi:hypothetical protein